MPKDYARSRDLRRKRKIRSAKPTLTPTWLAAGLLVVLIIVGIIYLKQRVTSTVHPGHTVVEPTPPQAKPKRSQAEAKKEPKPAASASDEKVHFDFYTILPNTKVPATTDKPLVAASKLDKALAKEKAKDTTPLATPVAVPPQKDIKVVEQTLLTPARTTPPKSTVPATKVIRAEEAVPPVKKAQPSKPAPLPKEAKGITKPTSKPLSKSVTKAEKATPVAPTETIHPTAVKPSVTATYIVQIAAFKNFEDADQLKAQLVLLGYEAKIKVIPLKGVNWHRVWIGPFSTAQAAEKVQKELQEKHTKGVVVKVK